MAERLTWLVKKPCRSLLGKISPRYGEEASLASKKVVPLLEKTCVIVTLRRLGFVLTKLFRDIEFESTYVLKIFIPFESSCSAGQ